MEYDTTQELMNHLIFLYQEQTRLETMVQINKKTIEELERKYADYLAQRME